MIRIADYINEASGVNLTIEDRIHRVISSSPKPLTLGVVFNRFKKIEKEDMVAILQKMLDAKMVEAVETQHPITGKKTLSFTAI